MNIIKVDLDIKDKSEAIKVIKDRLNFLLYSRIGLLKRNLIKKIELVYKSNYSCRIYLNKSFKDPLLLLLLQSILGDDYKHTAISLRDYMLGIENFNRLFTYKRYPDQSFKKAKIIDITKEVFSK